jgi:hypothetical protein
VTNPRSQPRAGPRSGKRRCGAGIDAIGPLPSAAGLCRRPFAPFGPQSLQRRRWTRPAPDASDLSPRRRQVIGERVAAPHGSRPGSHALSPRASGWLNHDRVGRPDDPREPLPTSQEVVNLPFCQFLQFVASISRLQRLTVRKARACVTSDPLARVTRERRQSSKYTAGSRCKCCREHAARVIGHRHSVIGAGLIGTMLRVRSPDPRRCRATMGACE